MRRFIWLVASSALYALAASTLTFIAAPLDGDWHVVEVDN